MAKIRPILDRVRTANFYTLLPSLWKKGKFFFQHTYVVIETNDFGPQGIESSLYYFSPVSTTGIRPSHFTLPALLVLVPALALVLIFFFVMIVSIIIFIPVIIILVLLLHLLILVLVRHRPPIPHLSLSPFSPALPLNHHVQMHDHTLSLIVISSNATSSSSSSSSSC
eukprot:762561-Hanusia_phi.AAC.2